MAGGEGSKRLRSNCDFAGCRPLGSRTGEAARSAPPVFRSIGEVARPRVMAGRHIGFSLLLELSESVLQCRCTRCNLRGLLLQGVDIAQVLKLGGVAGVDEGRYAIRLPEFVMVSRDLVDEIARVGFRCARFRDLKFGPFVGILCVDTLDMVKTI